MAWLEKVLSAGSDCMGGFSLRLLVSATTGSNASQKTRQGHCIFLIRSKPRVSTVLSCLQPRRSRSILDSVGAQDQLIKELLIETHTTKRNGPGGTGDSYQHSLLCYYYIRCIILLKWTFCNVIVITPAETYFHWILLAVRCSIVITNQSRWINIPLVCLLFSFNSTIWSVIVREFILALAEGVICFRTMKLYRDWWLKVNFSYDKLTIWTSQTMDSTRISSFFSGKHSDWECWYVYPGNLRAWSWWCSLLSFFYLIFISCLRMRWEGQEMG